MLFNISHTCERISSKEIQTIQAIWHKPQWYTRAPRTGGQTMNRAPGIATAKDIKAVCSSGMA